MFSSIALKNTLKLSCCFFLLASCSAGMRIAPANYKPSNKNKSEAIVILRVIPINNEFESSQLIFTQMSLSTKAEDEISAKSAYFKLESMVTPNAEYYVFLINLSDTRTANAITSFVEKSTVSGEERLGYDLKCISGYTFGFQIREPGVYYLGNLYYGQEVSSIGEVKLAYKIDSDINNLKAYLAAHYPNLVSENIKEKLLKKYWLNGEPCVQVFYY